MASGRPVVATAVDGTPEIIENNKNGLLVSSKSPNALSQAILSLLEKDDTAQKIGEMARLRVEEKFSFDMQFQKFEEIYNEVLILDENP